MLWAPMPKPPKSSPAPVPPPAPASLAPARLAMLHRYAAWISVALVLLATARIAATWTVFSHTVDEPAHVACGMEYLDRGVYRLETQHPPLTRAAVALLPRLAGARSKGLAGIWDEGLAILGSGAEFQRNLTLARAGNLPFFWLAAAMVFLFARRISGSPAAAVGAVFLFTFTPAVLAHAGVATTDMGFTALFLAAAYAGWRWLENPDPRRTALLGLAIGGAVLAKFSTLAFYPMTALLAVPGFWYFRRNEFTSNLRRYAAGLPAALLLAAAIIWTAYRFSWGTPPGWSFAVPAPELFAGIDQVRQHDRTGHLTYLLGRVNTVGWWYFYLVALAVKTPLPLLAAGLGGLLLLSTRKFAAQGWILPALVVGVLGYASLFSNIVIGTRHVLPVYAALAVAAAAGAAWLLERFPGAVAATAVAGASLWLAAGSVTAHPDYLGYFNLTAGDRPEEFLVDSDLDWGQDVKRLAARLRERGVTEVGFNQFAPGNLQALYGMPPTKDITVEGPAPGWTAVGVTRMKLGLFGGDRYVYDPGTRFWPEQIPPVERVGSGILLYYRRP